MIDFTFCTSFLIAHKGVHGRSEINEGLFYIQNKVRYVHTRMLNMFKSSVKFHLTKMAKVISDLRNLRMRHAKNEEILLAYTFKIFFRKV